jgi:hypothetical protein
MPGDAPALDTGVRVEDVITAVKEELAKAAGVAPHLRLTKFELELAVVVKKESAAKFEFEVPFLGVKIGPIGEGSIGTEATTKLTLSFEPPETFAEVTVPLEGLPAALATIEGSIHAGEGSPPRLALSEGEVSFAFGITKAGEVGFKIVVLTVGAKASREDAHTITLKFKTRATS